MMISRPKKQKSDEHELTLTWPSRFAARNKNCCLFNFVLFCWLYLLVAWILQYSCTLKLNWWPQWNLSKNTARSFDLNFAYVLTSDSDAFYPTFLGLILYFDLPSSKQAEKGHLENVIYFNENKIFGWCCKEKNGHLALVCKSKSKVLYTKGSKSMIFIERLYQEGTCCLQPFKTATTTSLSFSPLSLPPLAEYNIVGLPHTSRHRLRPL